MTIRMEQKLFPLLYTWHVLFGVVSFFFPSFKELSIPGGCLKIIVDSLCVFHTETRLFAVKKTTRQTNINDCVIQSRSFRPQSDVNRCICGISLWTIHIAIFTIFQSCTYIVHQYYGHEQGKKWETISQS